MQVDPMDRVITTTTNRTIMRDETTGSLIQTDFSKQAPFEPSFVGLEGKVLRFVADMTDAVPESLSEPYHERRFTIFYYLVDDSIQIVEQRKNNSGYMQVPTHTRTKHTQVHTGTHKHIYKCTCIYTKKY